uniref:Uncharacterized protein n=1 Tax=Glossina brevipalpis TaxID=37001 RepID=A0A1A9WSX1_9MUSC
MIHQRYSTYFITNIAIIFIITVIIITAASGRTELAKKNFDVERVYSYADDDEENSNNKFVLNQISICIRLKPHTHFICMHMCENLFLAKFICGRIQHLTMDNESNDKCTNLTNLESDNNRVYRFSISSI